MTVEQQLVFELTRYLDYDPEKIGDLLSQVYDFPYLLGQLAYNRVAGVAYYVLGKSGLLPRNREFRTALASLYTMNLQKHEAFQAALAQLTNCFNDVQFPYAFLKGSFLSSVMYPPGLRTSNDYDILVSQNDLTAIESLLTANGFIQGKIEKGQIIPATRSEIVTTRMNRGETVPFLKESKWPGMPFMEVDINFTLDHQAKDEADTVAAMLYDRQQISVSGDGQLYTLKPAEFLIHLCLHLFKEATVYNWVKMGRDLSLYKFLDIYSFLYTYGTTDYITTLTQKIRQYGVQKECYFAIVNTAELYPSLRNKIDIDGLLENILPENIGYLHEIRYPAEGKAYYYELSFTDWFFTPNRISMLKEK